MLRPAHDRRRIYINICCFFFTDWAVSNDIGYYDVFPFLVIARNVEDEGLDVRLDLLLGDPLDHLRHSQIYSLLMLGV